jgi:hemoglobin
VDLFYEKVIGDPNLAAYFEGVDLGRLKGHQRAFIGAALGGPEAYQGRDMGSAHAGLGVTDAVFDAVVGHLVTTLGELGIPEVTISQIGDALAPLRSDIVTKSAVARPAFEPSDSSSSGVRRGLSRS